MVVVDRWQISRTHLTLDDPNGDGDVLAMVSYVQGGCGISRNGTPLKEFYWELDEMDQCAATLLRLAGHTS
jgi:hypothetical protein